MKDLFVLSWLVVATCLSAFAQHPAMLHFTEEEGLPADHVYDVEQDDNGYMWFATDRGVSRYDGYGFTNYGVREGLPDQVVYRIYKDHHSRLWFVTASRQLAYLQKDSIVAYQYNEQLLQMANAQLYIMEIEMDTIGNIYFTVHGIGFFRITAEGKIDQLVRYDESNREKFLFYQVEKERMLYYTGEGSLAYRKENKGLLYLENSTALLELPVWEKPDVWGYGNLLRDSAWLLTIGKYLYLWEKGNLKKVMDLEGAIYDLFVEEEYIWLSTRKGIVKLNRQDLSVANSFLGGQNISSVYRDREGGVWMTTNFNGIYYMVNENVLIYDKEDPGLTFDEVISIGLDEKGRLYAGSNGSGINAIDTRGNVHFIETDRAMPVYAFFNYGGHMMYTAGEPYLNYIRDDMSVGRIMPEYEATITLDNGETIPCGHPALKSIHCTEDEVLMGGNTFLTFFKEGKLGVYTHYRRDMIRAEAVFRAGPDSIFAGGNLGLCNFNSKSGLIYLGKKDERLRQPVTGLDALDKDHLVISTLGKGILIMTPDTLYQFSVSNGLVSNDLRTLAVKGNEIWAGGINGVSKMEVASWSPLRYKITNIYKKDVLISGSVNQIMLNDSLVYLATRKGITALPRNYVSKKMCSPLIHITSVDVGNEPGKADSIQLNWEQRRISFNFTGISFGSLRNIHYKYRLSGVDREWIYTTGRQAQYTELSHGDYLFEVYAQNKDGVWSEQPATVSFTIAPPFWKTWWFLMIEAITVAIFIYLIIHWRVNYLRKKLVIAERFEKEKAQLELKALRAQMNPHFTFNTLNSIQSFITSREPEEAERYLAKFARLIRRILDHSRESFILLSEELEILELYLELEQMRFDGKFDYEVRLEETLRKDEVYLPGMLIQPYVENAILHGLANKESKGCIMISFERSGRQLRCEITDNGIGREASAAMKKSETRLHKSVGMSVTRERLELFNQQTLDGMFVKVTDLKDEEGRPLGTKVELLIDLNSWEHNR